MNDRFATRSGVADLALHTEPLERRRLLAAFASLSSSGTLTVNGDAAANTTSVALSSDGTKLVATRDGATVSFAASAVMRMNINAGGGNDRVTVNAGARPSTILGGSGEDTLVGGAGNDFIDGGQGADVADYSSRGFSFTGYLGYDYAANRAYAEMKRGRAAKPTR